MPSDLAAQLETRLRARRLLEFPVTWNDELIFPAYHGLSILNVAATIGALFGVETSPPLDEAVWQGENPFGQVQRVVLFVSDGLGYKWLRQMMDEDVAVNEAVGDLTDGRGALPLTSIVPSTTVVALPTLWTAVPPLQHGMIGTLMYLREVSMLANMLRFGPALGPSAPGTLEQAGLLPEAFIPLPTLPQRLLEVGVETHLLLAEGLINTGLSRLMHRGVTHKHGHRLFSDLWLRLKDVLKATVGQRCYISVYWDGVDSLSHYYGAHNAYLRQEIAMQLQLLRGVLNDPAVRDGQTLFMLIADHGHHDVQTAVDLTTEPVGQSIAAALRAMPSGDRRFSYLHLQPEMRPQVEQALAAHYSDRFAWAAPRTAAEAGLFGSGTPHPEFFARAGDLLMTLRLGSSLISPAKPHKPGPLHSMHAGLTDWEMLVPLLWRRL